MVGSFSLNYLERPLFLNYLRLLIPYTPPKAKPLFIHRTKTSNSAPHTHKPPTVMAGITMSCSTRPSFPIGSLIHFGRNSTLALFFSKPPFCSTPTNHSDGWQHC